MDPKPLKPCDLSMEPLGYSCTVVLFGLSISPHSSTTQHPLHYTFQICTSKVAAGERARKATARAGNSQNQHRIKAR